MKVLAHPHDLPHPPGPVAVAIGMFDGVHLGHQQVIRQAIADARRYEAASLAITFDRHPQTVLNPAQAPPLIYSLSQKVRVIQNLDVDLAWLIHFNHDFSQKSGEQFIRELISFFPSLQSICVGSSFTFGHRRSGNVALLKTLGQEIGFHVHGLAAVSLDGEPVSSTRIRSAIRNGDLDQAGQMLGRPYSLAGRVVRGNRLGTQLGVPTANIDVTGLITPPPGVYTAHARSPFGNHRGVVNIGYRPTLQQPATPSLHVEAHLFDFAENLYEQELELCFHTRLRDEQRFPSLDSLKKQLLRDIDQAKRLFQ